jgi:UDP-glucose 4-epimerase
MKVLVTGAGGFLGSYVVARLLEGGHEVRAMLRPASRTPEWNKPVEIFRADLRVADNLEAAFADIDCVIHLAAATSGSEDVQFATTVMATERFLEAMARTPVKRLVHISSLVVYDWHRIAREMEETSPVVTDIYTMGAYTICKVWQERLIARLAPANGWNVTTLRPGFVWGPDHGEIGGMGRHVGKAYLMFGPLTRLPLTHVVNCADAIVAAVENPKSGGQIFNIIDSDDIRVWRYVSEYAAGTRQPGFKVPIPYLAGLGVAKLAAGVSRLLYGPKGKLPSLLTPRPYEWQFKPIRFSNRKLRELLGWSPPLTFEQSVKMTYADRSKAAHASDFDGAGRAPEPAIY